MSLRNSPSGQRGRCLYDQVGKNQTRCKKKALEGEQYCHIHKHMSSTFKPEYAKTSKMKLLFEDLGTHGTDPKLCHRRSVHECSAHPSCETKTDSRGSRYCGLRRGGSKSAYEGPIDVPRPRQKIGINEGDWFYYHDQ
jgi:hypothetical protein